jgi:hypothetical protein
MGQVRVDPSDSCIYSKLKLVLALARIIRYAASWLLVQATLITIVNYDHNNIIIVKVIGKDGAY